MSATQTDPNRGATIPGTNNGSFAPQAHRADDSVALGAHPLDSLPGGDSDYADYGLEPHEAKAWSDAGFSAPSARQWSVVGFSYARAEDAAVWRGRGFIADMAQDWDLREFEPDEAEEWLAHGVVDPVGARAWDDGGYTPDEACRLEAAGIHHGHVRLLNAVSHNA